MMPLLERRDALLPFQRGYTQGQRGRNRAALSARAGWSVVALLVAFTGQQIWVASLSIPTANAAALLLIGGGLAAIWWIWAQDGQPSTRLQLMLLGGLILGISYQAVMTWLFNPAYGTDAVAFDQYAAALALHGHNPYAQSMAPSLGMFDVPSIFHTYRLDGSAVTGLSYPAGSFIPYIPVLALGPTTQVANIVDLAFWFTSILLLWWLLPREIKWLSGVLGAGTVYLDFVIGGSTDALFIPFVVLAVYRWDRFVADPRTASRWIGPLSLGIACAIKQTPWFLVPYLLLGLACEARLRRARILPTVGAYAAVVAGTFAIINLPFALLAPGAWVRGVMLPFLEPTVPDGQGLVNLSIFERLGGGRLSLFTLLGIVFVVASWLAFATCYRRLKRAWVPLVALSFFLPTRSFGSYLFMLLPAALIAATSVSSPAAEPFPLLRRHARTVLATSGALTVAVAALALSMPPPLSISIVGTRSTGQLQTLDEVTVRVTNQTGDAVTPHFTVNSNDHASTFWYANANQDTSIPPHTVVTVVLHAPNTAAMPGIGAPLKVEAFTVKPATISSSDAFVVSTKSTRIEPDAINKPVPVGTVWALTVQLRNRYGGRISQAGVPVTLGQTSYAQAGLVAGNSSINGHPEGQSPITAYTDEAGVATFHVRGLQAQATPVYYEAWLTGGGAVPHGYSNQLSVQYAAATPATAAPRPRPGF